ncbi:hypothetical protein VTI74DRAFT_10457 [Chaetomium olivicolor]
MATSEAGARAPHVPIDRSSDSESIVSEPAIPSSGSGREHLAVCRWRTQRYYDQECSRYFDCPSHVVERALSDDGQEREGEREEDRREQEDAGPSNAQVSPDSGSEMVSSPSEDGDDDDGDRTAPSPPREVPAAADDVTDMRRTGSRISGRDASQLEDPDQGPMSQSPDTMLALRTRTPAGYEVTEVSGAGSGDSAVNTSPASGPVRRDSGVVSGPPTIRRTVSGSASPTRMVSRVSPSPSATPERARPPEVLLPRWQPDSEATYCPICGTQFSFFVRKHHCRKCGRVVCNSCSPHRITIPYQYIVRPPGATLPVAQGASLSLLDSQGWYPEFGGERVRLCNPCVPDPNTAPPQTQAGPSRSEDGLGSPTQTENSPLARLGLYLGAGMPHDAQVRGRSVTMHPGVPHPPRPNLLPPRSNDNRILWGTPPAYTRATSTSQTTQAHPNFGPRYRSMLDVDFASPFFPGGASSSSSAHIHRHHPPRHQIPEEDECPVCHRELPPRSLPNFESLREAHINGCITSHSRYGGAPATTSGDDGDGDGDSLLPPVPPRRTGMFPYMATEKDCVDSAECSICLEEFEAGVAMARLECLCRFHRRCIDAWWERHPGRCPMHQHDGFGY